MFFFGSSLGLVADAVALSEAYCVLDSLELVASLVFSAFEVAFVSGAAAEPRALVEAAGTDSSEPPNIEVAAHKSRPTTTRSPISAATRRRM